MRSILLSAVLLSACTPEQSPLEVRIYGEEFIEAGIPGEVFVDGWAIRFDKFLVNVGGVEVRGAGVSGSFRASNHQIFDLTRASGGVGHEVASTVIADGRYDDTQFVVAPAIDAVAGNASPTDVELMRAGGHSVYVVGEATKGDVKLRFAWGFATSTSYGECESLAEVGGEEAATVQLTIHGDHLFYDDLFAEEPNVSFDLVADADADGDGDITQAELTAVDLRPLANYQVGSTDIVDLWRFIEYQTTTLGHIDGEGHCEAARETQ